MSLNLLTTGSLVYGTDAKTYICIKTHTAYNSNKPLTGDNWTDYWELSTGTATAWVNGSNYVATSPFDGFFEKHLPAFFFEKFKSNEVDRIRALLSGMEVLFDNIYQKVNNFPNELDVREAQVKYLYEIGQLLGSEDIENLDKYLDENGDVILITEEEFDATVLRQRTYIANTIGRYLLKGTQESIIRLLYTYGLQSVIRELWTEDASQGMSGDYFEYDNDLITVYGDSIYGDISGDIYNDESFDLISEMTADSVPISGASDIYQYDINNFGYAYVLDDQDKLYYKTSNEPIGPSAVGDTWYEFDIDAELPLSGDSIESYKLLNDKIYIKTDTNNLVVLDYALDDSPARYFTIDTTDCYFFDFIEDGSMLFMDRGSTLDIRDIADYIKTSAAISKPVGNLETIERLLNKHDGQYFITNVNDKGYILNVTLNTYDLFGSPTVYDLPIESDETNYDIFSSRDDEFTIIKLNATTGYLRTTFLYFDDDNTLTTSSTNLTAALPNVSDYFKYSSKVLIISDNKFGIYDLLDRTFNEYDYVTNPSYDHKKVYFLDKFYIKRFNGGDLDFTKIIGWNSLKDQLYKSHYFDIIVEISDITELDIAVDISTLKTFIENIIHTVKPVHTELLSILTVLTALTEEFVDMNDDKTLYSVALGGTQYTLKITAKYDGQHPWKRANNHRMYYNNDGTGGEGILLYGETPFDFDTDYTNTELDDLIYTNTTP